MIINNDRITIFKSGVEAISKSVAIVGGIAYFSGLIITNIYLANQGFFLFQLLKADYILIGGLWLVLLILGYIWVGCIIDLFRENEKEKKIKIIFTSLFFLFGYLICIAFISVFSVDEVSGLGDLHLLYVAGIFLMKAICVHIIIWMISKIQEQKTPSRTGYFAFLSIVSFICVFVFLSSYYRYALDVYPLYPRIIGGGRPTQAILAIKDQGKPSIQALGLDIDDDGLTNEVNILYENSNSLFVTIQSNNEKLSIQIKSSNIESIKYLPSN